MSRKITQPVNQVRLTNVAVVRMNRCGHRFEIACYRNKAVNYRQGVETDLSEVLQTDRVFSNVSKGEFAKSSDLREAFGDYRDEEDVCRRILVEGQLQISDMERSARMENVTREVAAMVAERCVDPNSDRPYTVDTIREAMRSAEFHVHPTRGAKQQFLDCVRLLKEKGVLPIERAKMKLCAVVPVDRRGGTERSLVEAGAELLRGVEGSTAPSSSGTARVEFLVDPSLYRAVDGIARDAGGRLEILRQFVHEEGDVNLESELARKDRRLARAANRRADDDDHHESSNGAHGAARDEVGGRMARSDERGGKDGDDGGDLESSLARDVAAMRIDGGDEYEDDERRDLDAAAQPTVNSRKANKKAQKKSKKARRREREEASERQRRIDAERARREERASRLEEESSSAAAAAAGGKASANGDGAGTVMGTAEGGGELRVAGGGGGGGKSCTTCGGSFSEAEYRSHFRSDWHRYNIKLKMRGVPPVGLEEFELCDADSLLLDDGPSL